MVWELRFHGAIPYGDFNLQLAAKRKLSFTAIDVGMASLNPPTKCNMAP